ncbi:MAG TPA: hypothetical protein VFQ61_23500 [Polyangiaceae bacterium]|nr:hypothetical protein [Polyangiaceae bacterium]
MNGVARARRNCPAAPSWVACAAIALVVGCAESKTKPPERSTEPSPNANIVPAPLSNEESNAQRSHVSDAGVPSADPSGEVGPAPEVRGLWERSALSADMAFKEPVGVRLTARLRWLDLPSFPRAPETNVEVLARLREASTFDLEISLLPAGRMRIVFDSDAFSLPRGSELRARSDRLGHLLVWDAASRYTILPAGALRAVFTEHRPDVLPLVKPKVMPGTPGNWLSMPTTKVELATTFGRLVVEQANIPNAGAAGELLCRTLSELVAADPLNPACIKGQLALRAELFSRSNGRMSFEVLRIDRERALEPSSLLVPPADARALIAELPNPARAVFPSEERLRELRLRPLPRAEKLDPSAPKQGLWIQNRSDVFRYVLLDGAMLARVAPRSDLRVDALTPGRYSWLALDFLGDEPTPLRSVEIPARIVIGEESEAK